MQIAATIPAQNVTITVPAPQIVYSNSWLGQTAIGTIGTPLFTFSNPGLYQLTASCYVYPNASPFSGSGVQVTANFSVPLGVIFSVTGEAQNNPSISIQPGTSAFLFAAQGQVLSLFSVGDSDRDGILDYYDLYLTIEQLQ